MAKTVRSFRAKMIILLGMSMLFSGGITFSLFKVLQHYYRSSNVQIGDPLAEVRYFIRNIGDINVFLMLFIPLAILFFFLLTKRYSVYFQKISEGIHHLAKGNFHEIVEIKSNDELEKIAGDINLARSQLKEAIEREKYAESSKDQLVVNLAHDLRTPLTSMLGYLDLILKDENLTDEQKNHYLTIAYSKSQRLEKLIDELFEITRMNYGTLTLKKSILNLSDLLHQLSEELFPIFEEKKLLARLDLPADMEIVADGNLLARVFENLLTNACRYGYDGRFVDIIGSIDEKMVTVQVINYGDPIPEEEIPYIFDMFYNGDKARTHQEGSTGLGLFIAKNIVEQHNGSISVESNPLRTIFTVKLPRDESDSDIA